MFKKVFISLAVLLLLTPSNAQQEPEVEESEQDQMEGQYPLDGQCPEIKSSMTMRGEKLDPQKLKGLWKTIYESEEKLDRSDCLSDKLQSFEDGNITQLQMFTGIKYTHD